MRRLPRPLAALVALGLLPSCTAVYDTGQYRSEPVPPEELCGAFAKIYCDAQVPCCGADPGIVPDCSAGITSLCSRGLSGLLFDERAGYDAEEAGLLVNEAREAAAACNSDVIAEALSRETIVTRLFAGTLPPGADCTPRGWSLPLPAGFDDYEALYACQRADHSCQLVLEDTSRFECRPLLPAGASCFSTLSCELDAFCRPTMDSLGECVPRVANGQPCASSDWCASGSCDRPDDTMPGTCVPATICF